MRLTLLPVFAFLLFTNAFCEDIAGGVTDNQVVEQANLKERLTKALEKGDIVQQDQIDRLYRAAPQSWLADSKPLHDARYETLRTLIGSEKERGAAYDISRICAYIRQTGASSLFSKLEKDYSRTNTYAFPEHLRMAGWPCPGDQHQLKGVRGQILATMVAVNGTEFLKKHISETVALTPNSDEKLLRIWALGYTVLPEGDDYLKAVAISGSDREKALAISGINHIVLQMTGHAKEGLKIDNDRLGNVEEFLADHGCKRAVTAGEYYPF